RDFHVTGVQTCALPIFEMRGGGACLPDYALNFTEALPLLNQYDGEYESAQWQIRGYDKPSVDIALRMKAHGQLVDMVALAAFARSEERRVGKGGRVRSS